MTFVFKILFEIILAFCFVKLLENTLPAHLLSNIIINNMDYFYISFLFDVSILDIFTPYII